MAYECPVFDFAFKAGADLSAAQYHFVKLNASGDVVQCSVAGEDAIGILQNIPKSGEEAAVRILGISKVVVNTSEVFDLSAKGRYVGTSSGGLATVIQDTATGADVTANILGLMLEAVTGSSPAAVIGTCLLRPLGRVVS